MGQALSMFTIAKATRPPTPSSASFSLVPQEPAPPEAEPLVQRETTLGMDREQTRTRVRNYEFLLLRCELGFPLWTPSPGCTSYGRYYMPVEIGDVGFLSHGLPFHTLFNITQPRTGPANRGRALPEGVEPHCSLEPPAVTIKKMNHGPWTTLSQPRGAILEQKMEPASGKSRLLVSLFASFALGILFLPESLAGRLLDMLAILASIAPLLPNSSGISKLLSLLCAFASGTNRDDIDTTHNAFRFRLSEKEGALLMLPHGSTLQNLVYTAEFTKRIRQYWRQWCEFANEKIDLVETGQSLCLVTGVERCSAWAMAAWDSNPGIDSDSLQLGVGLADQTYTWKFPPVRCLTQSKGSQATTPDSPQPDEETVFVRGFWIDSRNGHIKLQSPVPPEPGKGKGKDNGSNDENSESGPGGPQDSHIGGPSSEPSSSPHSSHPGPGHSEGSNPPSDALGPPIDEFDVTSSQITHPCRVINRFALDLISQIKPALLDAGCVAFSHDNDWISIIEESEEEIPPEAEIIRRICSKFKFAVEEDAICTVSMTDLEKKLLEQPEASSSQIRHLGTAFPVLLEFRDSEDEKAAGDHSTADSAPNSSASKSSPAPTAPPTSTPSWSLNPVIRSEVPVTAASKSLPGSDNAQATGGGPYSEAMAGIHDVRHGKHVYRTRDYENVCRENGKPHHFTREIMFINGKCVPKS
ncbi:hypothetical protein PQX77_017595 [Marasmius sp. AFHP31]|nr:hypothetical protein PQX77_017595 [Marasmius sp. AFHP31]